MSRHTLASARHGRDLIPGDPEALWEDAAGLARQAADFDDSRDRLGKLETGSWEGRAADRFAATVEDARLKLDIARDSHDGAARALAEHGNVLAWGQRAAAECIRKWDAGSYCLDTEPGLIRPTTTAEQQQAMAELHAVREAVNQSAEATASLLHQAASFGPDDIYVTLGGLISSGLGEVEPNPWHNNALDQIAGLSLGMLMPGPGVAQSLKAGAPQRVPLMKLGSSTTKDYRVTFFRTYPHLRDEKLVVHHAIEKQVMKRYPGTITVGELHSAPNLRGIPATVNGELHLRTIRTLWDDFYELHPPGTATRQQLLEHARFVDEQVGHRFLPPSKWETP
ncbi:putative T7SS-secreted protein [Cellulomonas sp. NPDC057328]|uniref:putative T7SS-secreted protein n=1 Tax=Cellulomonas sp. NPDC057328 TaxID=3346101 RepID=UPI003642F51D